MIASLISIYLHLNKISGRQQLRIAFLPKYYTLNLFLDKQHSKKAVLHQLSLRNLTSKQYQKLKSSIVDSSNYLNGLFSLLNNLYKELLSGFQLVDNFSDHFSFHTVNYKNKDTINTHIHNLDKIFKDSCSDPETVIVISYASIKNKVATSILHIHSNYNICAKIIHHTVNVTSTEAELFAIRCGINQVIQVQNTTHIIVITNAIYAAR